MVTQQVKDLIWKSARKQSARKEIPSMETVVKGWAHYIPMPAFADALDIAYVERVLHAFRPDGSRMRDEDGNFLKRTVTILTQGIEPAYEFKQGDIFYRTKKAATSVWGQLINEPVTQIKGIKGSTIYFDTHTAHKGEIVLRQKHEMPLERFVLYLQAGHATAKEDNPQPSLF